MIGSTIGACRIVSHLGSGGMGNVYKALDLRLHRHMALKILPPDVSADAERRQRFLQEARAASALTDPHLITVHDIAEATDFLVMELVEGRTLHEMVRTALPDWLATALRRLLLCKRPSSVGVRWRRSRWTRSLLRSAAMFVTIASLCPGGHW